MCFSFNFLKHSANQRCLTSLNICVPKRFLHQETIKVGLKEEIHDR